MSNFYLITVIIAVIILIIALTFIGLALKKSIQDNAVTVYSNPCPDYWKLQDGEKAKCLIPTTTGGKIAQNIGALTLSGQYDLSDNSMNSITRYIRDSAPITTTDGSYYVMDINSSKWTDASGYAGYSFSCAHKKWANDLGISWDGVSNAPCKKN